MVPTETRDEAEQTDVFLPKPPEKEYYTRNLPKKTGVDVSTQIEPQDQLFNFDIEVEPLLNVLIGKTLEVSLMEVEEEEELKAIRADKVRIYNALLSMHSVLIVSMGYRKDISKNGLRNSNAY